MSARFIRHLFATRAGTRRRFPDAATAAIEAAVLAQESRTSGEIRFAIETALEVPDLWNGLTPRERAAQVFAQLGVWDTELRNGVLIYVLMADRDVEIVADRAAAALVAHSDWESACRVMESSFRAGNFTDGAVAGIHAVGELLARVFPPDARDRNELPNQPRLL